MDFAFESAWESWENETPDRPTTPDLRTESSYVGALPSEAALHARRHRAAVELWTELRDRTYAIESWDGSIRAAADAMKDRVAEIAHALGLLARVSNLMKDFSLADQLSSDAPLSAFLAGSYLWLDGVIPALSVLARQLGEMDPDYALFRRRLAEHAWIFELAEREEAATPLAWFPDHAAGWVRQLFAAMKAAKLGVDQPFG